MSPRPLLPLLLAAALAGACSREAPPPDLRGIEAAERALAEGRWMAARRELESLPPLPEGAAEARLRAAEACMRCGDPSRAADLLGPAAAGPPPATEAVRLLRAEALVRSGRLEEAGTALADLEKAGLRGSRWRFLYALLSLARGEETGARMDLEDLVRKGSRDPDVHVLWAQQALDSPLEAQRRLHEALDVVTDRIPVLRALGRLLAGSAAGDARRAAEALEEVVRARPWDREARLSLVAAGRRAGGKPELARALAVARGLRGEDPRDPEIALALAETTAAAALAAMEETGGGPAAARDDLMAAAALYEALASSPHPDTPLGIRILQGLARVHVEAIPLDAPGEVAAEGSHYRRALAALDRAEALDPEGRWAEEGGSKLLAETHFLRGRAHRRAHHGDGDHTEAVRAYEKALEVDRRHVGALWDLGLLYYDFLRGPEYIRKARLVFEACLRERERRGMEALDPGRLAIVAHVRKLAAEGKGRGPDDAGPR